MRILERYVLRNFIASLFFCISLLMVLGIIGDVLGFIDDDLPQSSADLIQEIEKFGPVLGDRHGQFAGRYQLTGEICIRCAENGEHQLQTHLVSSNGISGGCTKESFNTQDEFQHERYCLCRPAQDRL